LEASRGSSADGFVSSVLNLIQAITGSQWRSRKIPIPIQIILLSQFFLNVHTFRKREMLVFLGSSTIVESQYISSQYDNNNAKKGGYMGEFW